MFDLGCQCGTAGVVGKVGQAQTVRCERRPWIDHLILSPDVDETLSDGRPCFDNLARATSQVSTTAVLEQSIRLRLLSRSNRKTMSSVMTRLLARPIDLHNLCARRHMTAAREGVSSGPEGWTSSAGIILQVAVFAEGKGAQKCTTRRRSTMPSPIGPGRAARRCRLARRKASGSLSS